MIRKKLKVLATTLLIPAFLLPISSLAAPCRAAGSGIRQSIRTVQAANMNDPDPVTVDFSNTNTDGNTVYGNTVSFDANGSFTDTLSDTSHLYASSPLTFVSSISPAGGATSGIVQSGTLLYKAGSGTVSTVSIDVRFQKWQINVSDTADELKAYAATYDEATGIVTYGDEISLTRRIDPTTSDVAHIQAAYISAAIPSGAQYLLIVLPQSAYYNNPDNDCFNVTGVTLTNNSAGAPENYLTDTTFSNFSSDSTLAVADASGDPTWASTNYIASASMTSPATFVYEAPEGKEFSSAYVENWVYYDTESSVPITIKVSRDGTDFRALATPDSDVYDTPLNWANWAPMTATQSALPDGVKYIEVCIPTYSDGWTGARITGISLGYKDAVAVTDNYWYSNTAGPVPLQPIVRSGDDLSTAVRTESPIQIDGVVPVDASGSTTGEWAGAQPLTIQNGDATQGEVFLKYDYDYLYVGAKIKDSTPMINLNTGANIWNGDCLELFIGKDDLDCTANPDYESGMIPTDVQVVLSAGDDYGSQSYFNINGVNFYPNIVMKTVEDADGQGYTLEAALPLKDLGLSDLYSGKSILLNAVINDGSSSGRGQWGWTTQGESTKKDRSLWGQIDFAPSAAPTSGITVHPSVSGGTVTVSGKEPAGGKNITMIVYDGTGTIAYLDETKGNASGGYSFSFKLQASGDYTVRVGGEDVDEPAQASFTY